jgi:hypothetical protein
LRRLLRGYDVTSEISTGNMLSGNNHG